HRDDVAVVGFLEPRHAERRVEPARKREDDGGCLAAHGSLLVSVEWRQARPVARWRRYMSARCARALGVAVKIVSSPPTLPTISGQPERSSASATRCAAPIAVLITSRLAPAGCTSRNRPATSSIAASAGSLPGSS